MKQHDNALQEQPESEASAIVRDEVCAASSVRRVAAMLDLPPSDVAAGDALPHGWHFFLLAADTPRSSLRSDGFPGLGVPMPDLGLPRLMLGGRTVEFRREIAIGSPVVRTSAMRSLTRKKTASGEMAIVVLVHELRIAEQTDPAIVETQTYLLLPPRGEGVAQEPPAGTAPSAPHVKTVMPDETLLFQYSALGFNSHRIHLDRDHARAVEGFPDLVVNGGLSTLLLTEFLRTELAAVPSKLSVRHLAPLYCNRPIALTADPLPNGWRLRALDEQNRIAVDMEVETS